jgi:hypothetical protein
MKNEFTVWLKAQRNRHPSLIGDLARDAIHAGDWPNPAIPFISDYVLYLENRPLPADPWAYKALAAAWEEWLRGKGEPTAAQIQATTERAERSKVEVLV